MFPYVGQINLVPFNFAPRGWAKCDGQLLSIAQYPALFAVLGTAYGGDGNITFALPDLRGRVPVHFSGDYPRGSKGGAETVTLNVNELPSHDHAVKAVKAVGTLTSPANNIWAASSGGDLQYATSFDTVMAADAITPAEGGNRAHDNMPPMTVMNFIIALTD
jgi:microcystin-dependent protein